MRRFHLTRSGMTVALLCGLSLPAFAQIQSDEFSERRQQRSAYKQHSSMQQSTLARQEAEIAREAAYLADRAAQLARRQARQAEQRGMEQYASLAEEKVETAREMAELANRRADLAEQKANRITTQQGGGHSQAIARQEAQIARELVTLAERSEQLAQREARLVAQMERSQERSLSQQEDQSEQGSGRHAQQSNSPQENMSGQQLQSQQFSDLGARETNRGLVLTLEDVLFELNDDDLRPQAREKLSQLALTLKQYPDRRIRIEGHTDSSGDVDYNQQLSRNRAESVRAFLVEQGINEDRIVTRGYGQEQPLASNDSEAGRQRNRRVEIVMVPRVDQFSESSESQ